MTKRMIKYGIWQNTDPSRNISEFSKDKKVEEVNPVQGLFLIIFPRKDIFSPKQRLVTFFASENLADV